MSYIDNWLAWARDAMTQHLQSIGVKVHGVTQWRTSVDDDGKLVFEEMKDRAPKDIPQSNERKDGYVAMAAHDFRLEDLEIGDEFRLCGPLVFVKKGCTE